MHKALLNTGYFVSLLPSPTPVPDHIRKAFIANMFNYGYLVSFDDTETLTVSTMESVLNAAKDLTTFTGEVFYPNFPASVRSRKTITLLVDQIVHYISWGTLLPVEDAKARKELPLIDSFVGAKKLELIHTIEDVVKKFVEDYRALSNDNTEIVQSLAPYMETKDVAHIVATAKNSENVGILLSSLLESPEELVDHYVDAVSTPDALLRLLLIATAGNIDSDTTVRRLTNLPKGTRIASLPRRVRSRIVAALPRVSRSRKFPADEFLAHKNLWKRVLTPVHPFEVDNKDAKVILDAIFDNSEYKSLNATYEGLLVDEKYGEAAQFLADNSPGRLYRSCVTLAAHDVKSVVEALKSMNGYSTVSTLISAINAARFAATRRTQFREIAGHGVRMEEREATLSEQDSRILEEVLVTKLKEILSQGPIPESGVGVCGNIPVTLAARSAFSSDRKAFEPGEIVPVDGEGNVLRSFVHWVGNDLDLGIVALSDTFVPLATVDYTSYHTHRDWVTFSGDITYAPRGAWEFFDIDLTKVPKNTRYIALSVVNFTGDKFSRVDHRAGFMFRSDADSGEIYDARTVVSASSCNVDSNAVVPAVFDIETGNLIWCGSDTANKSSCNSTTSLTPTIIEAVKDVVDTSRVTYGELATWWAAAHQVEVDEENSVDIDKLRSLITS